MKNKYFILILTLLAFSCQKKTIGISPKLSIEDKSISKINTTNPNSDVLIDTEDIFEILDVIQLETEEDFFMASCDKVFFDENFFVLDKKFSNLLVFDSNGKFVRKIGKLGRGPGEYQSINDIQIDKASKTILIYSLEDLSLFKYNYEGEFIEKQRLDFFADTFIKTLDNRYLFYTNYNTSAESEFNNLLILDSDFRVLGKHLSYNKDANAAVSFSGTFRDVANSNDYLFSNALSDTIWILNNKLEVSHAYKLNFNGKEWKNGFDFLKLYQANIDELNYISNNIFIDHNLIITSIMQNRRWKNIIINRESTNSITENDVTQDLLFKIIKTPLNLEANDIYISAISANSYQALIRTHPEEFMIFKQKFPRVYNALEQIETTDNNPALIKFKITIDETN